MSVNPISPAEFQGGQITDLPEFTGTLDGTELMEIVAAGAGQNIVTEGVNYNITTTLLALLLININAGAAIISDGENNTPGDPYVVPNNVFRVYINKTIAEPTYIAFDPAADYYGDVLVKDVAGTVEASPNDATISFDGAESADGNTTVPIGTAYGGYWLRPIASLARWTLGSA